MALPNSINPATPLGSDSKEFGDDELRGIKQFLVDLLGIPTATQINNSPFTIDVNGNISNLRPVTGTIKVGATADAFVTQGLVVDQAGNDNLIGVFRSSDVAQPVTASFSSGTFGAFSKVGATAGGLAIYGLTSTINFPGVLIHGIPASANSAKSPSAIPAVLVAGNKSNGATGVNPLAASENLFGVGNGTANVVFLVDGDGSVRIKPGLSGAASNPSYDDLVIEGAAGVPMGINLLTPTNTQRIRIAMGDPQDNDAGGIDYDNNTDTLSLISGGATVWASTSSAMSSSVGGVASTTLTTTQWNANVAGNGLAILDSNNFTVSVGGNARFKVVSNQIFLGTAMANTYSTGGVTIGQGSPSGTAGLTIESDENQHLLTGLASTKTYFTARQFDPDGGAFLSGYGPGARALLLVGYAGVGTTTKGVLSGASVEICAYKRSGTVGVGLGGNENICVFRNTASTTRMIVDSDGDLHFAGNSNANDFDDYEDIELLTAAKALMRPEDSDFRKRYKSWVDEHALTLARGGVITYNPDGTHFTSMQGLFYLTVDTIRQLYDRIQHQQERIVCLERALLGNA